MRSGSDTLKPEVEKAQRFDASIEVSREFTRPSCRIWSSSGNSRRTSSVKRHEPRFGDQQIRHGEERVQLRGVLEQTAIADLLEPEPVLDDVKRVLDLRANAGLQLFDLFGDTSLRVVRQRPAIARAQGDVPPSGDVLLPVALLDASIACVTESVRLFSMKQFMRLGH